MNRDTVNRRQLMAAVTVTAIGTLIPEAARAQSNQGSRMPLSPADAGPIHGDMLLRVSETLGTNFIDSKQGLSKLVHLLVQFEVINGTDADRLQKLIDAIFADPDAMHATITAIFNEAKAKAGEVAVAVISIAKNSVEYAKKNPRKVYIVSSDVSGALTGAATGAKLGGVTLAVVGVVAGAVASSAGAAFSSKK